MHPRHHSRGYTLIEVLVAFMIMALALTVLLRIFSGGLRNVSVSSDYSQAVLIAESRLATAGIDGLLAPGEQSGTEAEKFQWTRQVTNYQPTPDYSTNTKGSRAYHVAVSVSWPNGNRERRIEVATVKLVHDERRP